MEIWRKNRVEDEHMIKMFIEKLHDENEELKGCRTWLKSQDEEL